MTAISGSRIIPAEQYQVPTEWRIEAMEIVPPDFFTVTVKSDIDTTQRIRFPAPTASMALNFINTADFSPPARPFAQRVLDYIVNNGYISGSTTTGSAG